MQIFLMDLSFGEKKPNHLEWELDLRYPLNCKDNVFDGVYTEHTLEHLYPDQAQFLLNELYRIMKCGARIRITVPDLEKYVLFYMHNKIDDKEVFDEKYKTNCSAIRNITQNYFHLSVWDFDEIKYYLINSGFNEVVKMKFSQTKNHKLNLDLKERSWETLYVEAVK